MAQETSAKQGLVEQFEAADARIAELENELATAQDELALRDNENESLRTSLDLAMAENAALTERLTKSDGAQHSTSSQLEYLQTALTAAEAECSRHFSEARDSRMEASTLTDVLARMTSRAEIAERLLADAANAWLPALPKIPPPSAASPTPARRGATASATFMNFRICCA